MAQNKNYNAVQQAMQTVRQAQKTNVHKNDIAQSRFNHDIVKRKH